MSIQILNNGASLKIVRDAASRLVLKQQIKEVSTSGTNLKIETCGCGSSCLFFPFAEVTNPATANVTALRDAVNVMLNTTIEGGSLTIEGFSTEQKQVEELAKLQELKTSVQDASAQIQAAINSGFPGKATEARQSEILLKLDNITSQLLDALTGISGGGGGEGSATDASVLLVKLAVETLTATLPAMLATLKSGLATENTQQVIAESLTELYDQLYTLVTLTASQTTDLTNALLAQLAGKATADLQTEGNNKLQNIMAYTGDALAGLDALAVEFNTGFSGKATAALQTTGNNHLNDINGKSQDIINGLDALAVEFSTGFSGKSTEQKQADTIVKLAEIKTVLMDMQIALQNEIQSELNGKSTEAKQDALITLAGQTNTAITTLQDALASAILTGPDDMATQTKQDDILTGLTNIISVLNQLLNELQRLNEYRFDHPLRQEVSGMTTYKGYAAAGTAPSAALWAIQRITTAAEGTFTTEWANGSRNFMNAWDDRIGLPYA